MTLIQGQLVEKFCLLVELQGNISVVCVQMRVISDLSLLELLGAPLHLSTDITVKKLPSDSNAMQLTTTLNLFLRIIQIFFEFFDICSKL